MSLNRATAKISELPFAGKEALEVPRLNWLERAMVQHAHPTKLILDTVAYLWGLYLFSRHELAIGLVVLFGVGGLGTLLTHRSDRVALARTTLGRYFYVAAYPVNMVLQLAGFGIISYGSWIHSAPTIL